MITSTGRYLVISILVALIGCEQEQMTSAPNETSSLTSTPLPTDIDMAEGEQVYRQHCASCHDEGIAGAPRIGDSRAWEPRLQKGMKTMLANAINGYHGNDGVMPPRGGAPHLSDSQILAAVTYLVQKSKKE